VLIGAAAIVFLTSLEYFIATLICGAGAEDA